MLVDGQFITSISEDGLSAYGTFKPAASGGRALEVSDIEAQLNIDGIVAGIDWEVIRESLFSCNNEHRILSSVLIARGTDPKPQLPEAWIFSPMLQQQSRIFRQLDGKGNYHPPGDTDEECLYRKDQKESGGRVDHRERNSIEVIHEGQLMAVKHPVHPGELGISVKGEEIPFQEVELRSINPGINTREEEGKIFASASGRLVWDKESFGVDTNFEINGQVGYSTGNIRFPGNIILKGEIQDRFKIWAGGSIQSNATLDAFEVFCKGDLICSEGILGRNQGVVRVKGNLEAKFIENCRVDVFGDINIKSAVLNSRVNSNGEILLEKGRIVGGETRFRRRMQVNDLGNHAGVPTLIAGGVDFVARRRLEHNQKRVGEISAMEQKLRLQIEHADSPRLQKSLSSVLKELRRLQDEAVTLLEATEPDATTVLEVLGTAYAGCTIRFGKLERQLTEDVSRRRFRPDSVQGRVLDEDL